MNINFKTLITLAATPLLFASCSDEVSSDTNDGGKSYVTFTAKLPDDLSTRAFGEASQVKSLNMPYMSTTQPHLWKCLRALPLKQLI